MLALRRPVEQEDDALVTEKLNRVYADDGGALDLALSALPARVLEPEEWSFAEKLGGAISQSRLDPRRAGTGHRYVAHDASTPRRTLRFRRRVRPAWEKEATGAPRLDPHARRAETTTLGVGDELRLSSSATSRGGASVGLAIFAVMSLCPTKRSSPLGARSLRNREYEHLP